MNERLDVKYLQGKLSNIFTTVKMETGSMMVGDWIAALTILEQIYLAGCQAQAVKDMEEMRIELKKYNNENTYCL